MRLRVLTTVFTTVLASLFAASAHAADCKADVEWKHVHSKASKETITDDIKGSRATRIEICRAEESTGNELIVTVQFEGARDPRPLEEGSCIDKLAKWGLLKTHGARLADATPAVAQGRYRVCKE